MCERACKYNSTLHMLQLLKQAHHYLRPILHIIALTQLIRMFIWYTIRSVCVCAHLNIHWWRRRRPHKLSAPRVHRCVPFAGPRLVRPAPRWACHVCECLCVRTLVVHRMYSGTCIERRDSVPRNLHMPVTSNKSHQTIWNLNYIIIYVEPFITHKIQY